VCVKYREDEVCGSYKVCSAVQLQFRSRDPLTVASAMLLQIDNQQLDT